MSRRRLRAQRRRGRRAGDDRGRRAAAARVHGQRRSRWSRSPTTDGLLEYPVYTKPATWRGLEVPEVLLSGDHARIAAWRHDQSVRRTAERRPDLLPTPPGRRAGHPRGRDRAGRAGRRRRAAHPPARLLGAGGSRPTRRPDIPPLHEDLDDVEAWLGEWTTLVLRSGGRLVGAVRGRLDGRRVGHRPADGRPRPAGAGARAGAARAHRGGRPGPSATGYVLFTGARSERNHADVQEGRLPAAAVPAPEAPGAVRLTKRRRASRFRRHVPAVWQNSPSRPLRRRRSARRGPRSPATGGRPHGTDAEQPHRPYTTIRG